MWRDFLPSIMVNDDAIKNISLRIAYRISSSSIKVLECIRNLLNQLQNSATDLLWSTCSGRYEQELRPWWINHQFSLLAHQVNYHPMFLLIRSRCVCSERRNSSLCKSSSSPNGINLQSEGDAFHIILCLSIILIVSTTPLPRTRASEMDIVSK